MFKKLRNKFIAIIMASVALVLAITFSVLCLSEYQREMDEVNKALSSAIDRAASQSAQPAIDEEGQLGQESLDNARSQDLKATDSEASASASASDSDSDSASASAATSTSASSKSPQKPNRKEQSTQKGGAPNGGNGINSPHIGGRELGPGGLVPVAVYALSTDGDLALAEGVATASISDSVLDSAVQRITDASEGQGAFIDLGLHYEKRVVGDTVYVAFADASSASSWQSLALRLVVAALVVLAIFFVLSLFFSKWALQPVKDAWDSQRQFIADASHELKTPLTVILANASILLKHPDDTVAAQSKWIESTQAEANSMHELVNEMLELTQVEERAQLPMNKLDFSDLVDGEALQFESVAFERGCEFDYVIEPDISIFGNEARLKKMVSTLSENALKYVDDGGQVHIVLARKNNNAMLAISNTGSFVSAEDLPHIFDRFYRADKARTSGEGGFGLGLAIARETARAHAGDIVCDSTPEMGTVFTVTLPLC